MALLIKLSLPESHSEALFEFIKMILPDSNNLPESYYRFNQSFKNKLLKSMKLCHICQSEFVDNACPSSTCYSKREEKKINIKKSIKVVVADIKTQIHTVLSCHYESIVKYKHELSRNAEIKDICNGSNYKLEENTITLILFVDAVTYTKSVANSMWAMFSEIVELPPILRTSYENIIFHSLWSGDLNDFNLYLEKYNSEIDEIIKNGILINGLLVKVKIHGFIADTPARCKALNCIYFNGNYGCIFCYHPTGRHSNKKTIIYPIKAYNNIKLRNLNDYLNDLNTAIETGKLVNGVKGETYLYNWISIPYSVIIDYMHLCLIGTFKKIISDLLNSINKKQPYYLGKFLIYV